MDEFKKITNLINIFYYLYVSEILFTLEIMKSRNLSISSLMMTFTSINNVAFLAGVNPGEWIKKYMGVRNKRYIKEDIWEIRNGFEHTLGTRSIKRYATKVNIINTPHHLEKERGILLFNSIVFIEDFIISLNCFFDEIYRENDNIKIITRSKTICEIDNIELTKWTLIEYNKLHKWFNVQNNHIILNEEFREFKENVFINSLSKKY